MDISIGYRFAEGVIITELAIVVFIVILTVVLKVFYSYVSQRDQRIRNKINGFLSRLIINKEKFNSRKFPSRWKKLHIILDVIDALDQLHSSGHWREIRDEFITNIVLPLARKAAVKRNWEARLYAAKAFTLIRESHDHQLIEKLVKDEIPLVSLYAGRAALINHAENAINALISKIAYEPWGAQLVYLRAFEVMPDNSRGYFEKKLESSKVPEIRSACYNILLKYPASRIKWDISPDVQSDVLGLKIAALKYVAHVDREAAVPYLIDALGESDIKVKLISLHRLNMLKAREGIPQVVKCLDDTDWWVKMSAAQALKNMGDEGERALKSNKPALDVVSVNFSHLLNTWW